MIRKRTKSVNETGMYRTEQRAKKGNRRFGMEKENINVQEAKLCLDPDSFPPEYAPDKKTCRKAAPKENMPIRGEVKLGRKSKDLLGNVGT